MLAEPVEIGDAELLHHLDEPSAALVIAGGERIDVALDLQRFAHIGADHPQQVVVHPAFARQCHQRDREALLVDLPAVRPHAEAADIDDMDRAGEEADRLAAQKGRADHGQIVQMAAGQPRVVGDVMVARPHRLQRKGVEEMFDRRRHGIDVARRAGDRLRQHVAVAVEDPGREIPGLAHRRRKRGAHEGLRLLLDDRDQPAPHDLQVDLRECGIRSAKHQPISPNAAPAAGIVCIAHSSAQCGRFRSLRQRAGVLHHRHDRMAM